MKKAATKAPAAPVAIQNARLFSKTGRTDGLTFQLASDRPMVVGRTQEAQVIVPDPLVSRQHAKISFEDGHFVLENLSKTNGTLLNGWAIEKEVLEHLDVVGFGPNNEFIFALEKSAQAVDADVPPVRRVLLVPDGGAPPIELAVGKSVLGRAEDCTVVLPQKPVSSQHARIEIAGDKVELEDLGSANGTFLNGERVDKKLRLKDGDVLLLARVANFVVRVDLEVPPGPGAEPPPPLGYLLIADEEPSLQLSIPLEPGHYVAGREASCSLIIENKKSVSRRHAEFEVDTAGRLIVRDLASGNGTFVNGVKIRESALQVGDSLALGLVAFKVQAKSA